MDRMTREIREVEATITAARTEREQVGVKLESVLLGLSDKLRRRISGQDHIYVELDADEQVDLVRGFFEGFSGSGTQGGVPYTFKLTDVRGRAHRDRIFLSASYTMTYGEKSCSGPTSGYLLHLDRDRMKLQEMQISCLTPQGSIEILLADRLEPMPLPIGIQRRAALKTGPETRLGFATLEMVTPLQASLDPYRIVLRAPTISLKGVKP
ncbi:MAG: hypothetical protein FJ125_03885 [Deltaproteobacteria bacterium]|nr:hypothetical protein [Deltaproteobacteria bacterium]